MLLWPGAASAQTTITIGIGTQDTTTNTVTTGTIVRELKLFEKHLPKDGKYANVKFQIEWNNFTSGPPVTNGMMANKLQYRNDGRLPLVVNGFTFQSNPESKAQLIAVAAYNIYGSGNGLVVHKDSAYFELSDLKGKVVSVPFGSAAHGMVLKAMQDRKWPADYFQLVSQSPEVGSTNLQEKKIDAHADFVPFAELLPFRGFARKIFDGVETNAPTWHGVVVRTDFAEKYPEVVVAYIKAVLEANAWVRADPKTASEMIAKWTGIDKEVVYIFLGPGGIMTMDPTIKPELVQDAAEDAKVLQNLGRMKEFDVAKWVNDSYVRKAYGRTRPRLRQAARQLRELRDQGRGRVLQEADQRTAQGRRALGRRRGHCILQQPGLHARRLCRPQGQRQEDHRRLRLRHRTRHQAVCRPGILRRGAARTRSRRSCSRRTPRPTPPRSAARSSVSPTRSNRR